MYTLDENVNHYLNDVNRFKLEDISYDSSFGIAGKYKEITVEFDSKRKSETSKKIIEIARSLFKKSGLDDIDTEKGVITYTSHLYENDVYSYNYYNTPSRENENYINAYSCYFVTQKDEELENGNLDLYEDDDYTLSVMIGLEENKKKEFPLKTGTAFIIDGDTLFNIQSCNGKGVLNIIKIVFLPNEDENEDEDEDE